ncbi:MAG TPA: DUF4142 domain-containing protein [Thermoanaerobaculia bacterium]|nr:DUF4142 domain-containing protein [Thermoanaerobaculia bacterium]
MSKKIPGFAILGVVGFLLLTPTVARAQMGSGTGSTGAGNGMGTGTSAEPNALKPESAAMSDKELETFDRKFLIDAARGGMLEVQAGQLAVERAASPDVKAFGQRMVDDHGKANERLKQVAAQYGVALPSDLTKSQKATLDRLSKLSGPEFDKAYIQDMVGDHKEDVKDFNNESRRGRGGVKALAKDTLPTLQDHLKMAEDLSAKTSTAPSGAGGSRQ